MTERISTPPVLIVLPLQSGLWRVKEADGDKLLDVYYKGAAVQFALSWARSHAAPEVRIYNADAELEVIFQSGSN
jgi:hypothetical protein